MSKYGVETVVGGWDRTMTPELLIPWTTARTQVEHAQLRSIIKNHLPKLPYLAVELGCGYGRNLFLLDEFATEIVGVERDQELAGIAADIWVSQKRCINVLNQELTMPLPHSIGLALTYTVLQHITDDFECKSVIDNLQKNCSADALLVICEEIDATLNASEVKGRSLTKYESMFDQCKLISFYDRQLIGGKTTAKIMVFKRG